MSATIDSRVVEMRFDNKNFESNVQTSLSTLDKLKNSLNMNGAAKSFEQIDNAAKKVNMSGLGNAVESVRLKFSALEVMAVTALSNITTAALNAGIRITKALTLDPVKLGFSEYETQIGAVQTILANTSHQGTNLQQVNRALDELNIYADKTIYNFTEMTRNIGTFTAAGIDLQTAVDAIRGIANLAAVSGSTSQQASTAMYQLSQALAAGRVTLMDWNSVVNAGMGGKVFQDALIRTSELLGTGAQAAIDTYGSFRESLTKGEWLTTEVLTETLKQFAGAYSEADLIQQGFTAEQARSIMDMAKTAEDAATKVKTFTQLFDTLKESAQSGWTQTWEILIGDFEEAKEVLTEISNVVGDVISKSAEARNEILSGGLSSGWKQLLSVGIADEAGYIDSIQEVARAHGDAFDQMVADSDSFSDALKKGLQEGVISSETLSNAVFNLQEKMSSMSVEELKAAGYTSEMITQIESLASGLRDGSISMDEFTEKIMRPSGRENLIQALWNAAKGLMSVITPIKEAFTDIFPPITADQLYKITEGFRSLTERLTLSETASTNLKNTFKGLFAVVDIIGKAFISVIKAIGSLLGGIGKLGGGLLSITGSFGEWLVKLNETIETTDIFNKVFGSIANFIKNAAAAIKNFITTVAKNFKIPGFELFHNLLGRVQDRMSQVGEAAGSMKSGVVAVFKFMGEALANCQFAQILKTIWNTVKTITSGIVNSFSSISEAIISSLGEANFSGIIDLFNGASLGAIAVGITKLIGSFRGAIDKIGNIKESFIGILDSVRGCLEAYQSQLKADLLLKIASAIAILTASIVVLSLIDSHKLSSALGAITVLFADLMASMAVFNKIGGKESRVMKSVTAMLGISTAVLILASALKKLGDLDVGQLITGLVGIAGLTAMVIAAAKAMSSGGPTIIKGATRMVIFAAAIKVLASACEDLSKLSWGELAKGLVGVGVLLASVSMFTNNTKFMVNSIATATGIVIFASAIKVLASACKDFGSMSWNEVIKGLVSVGVLLTSISKFTNKTKLVVNSITTATGIVILASAIKVLASACKDFGSMSWNEVIKGLVSVGVLLASVSKFTNKTKFVVNSITTATGIVILASAIKVLASACKDFGSMSWNEIIKGLVSVGVLLASISKFTNKTKFVVNSITTATGIVILAAAIKVLASACEDFGSMSWNEIIKGLISVGVLLASVSQFMNRAKFGVNSIPIAAGIMILAVAIKVLASAVGDFGSMSWEEIAKGLIALGGSIVILSVGLKAMNGTLLGSAAMLVAASALLIMTTALSVFGAMSWESIAKGLVALAGAFAVIGVAGLVLAPLVPTILSLCVALALIGVSMLGIGAGLTLVSAGLSALAVALTALATAGTAGATAIVASLTIIFTGIAELIPTIMTKIGDGIAALWIAIANNASAIGEAFRSVILMLVVIFGECVPAIADVMLSLVDGILKALVEYTPSIVDSIMGFLIGILEGIARNLPSLIQAAVDVLMSLFSGVVDALSGVDMETLLQGITGVGLLTAIMAALAVVSALIPGAMLGVLGMGAVIAELALVLAAVGMMAQIPGLEWFIDEGGDLLQHVGTAIGKFIGGIAGGFASGVASQLPQIATDLSGFMANIQPFVQGASAIDSSMMDGVNALADTIVALTAANILDGLTSWMTGGSSLTSFAEELVPFGKAMKQFSEEVAGIDGGVITNASTAGKALAEMASTLPNSGGVAAWFAGENDMSAFAEQLVPFGKAMKGFADEVAGMDTAVVGEASTAGKALAEMAATLPNSGGVAAWFAGENDMNLFSEQLVPFGRAMKGFADEVAGMDTAVVGEASTAGKALAEMAATLPNSGGVAAWFAGENDMLDFCVRLVPFGRAMKGFAEAVSGLRTDVVQNGATAGKALVELANTIPNTGGVVSWFTGDNDLILFGEQLVPFGQAMKNYSLSVAGLDSNVVTNSTNAAKALMELANNLPNNGGIVSWFTGDNDIASFGEQLVEFGKSFANYYNSISGIDVNKLNGVVAEFRNLVDLANVIKNVDTSGMSNFAKDLTNLGNSGVDGFINAFVDANSKITTAFTTMVNSIVRAFESQYYHFTVIGSTMMTNLASGVRSKEPSLKNAFITIIAGCLTAIRNKYREFYNAGEYLVEGFAKGIEENTWQAEESAAAMASAAADAAKAALDINSPSKVGRRIGGFFGMGFVNSLIDYADKSYEAGVEMASAAKNGLSNAISKVRDFIEGNVDAQPTIRPVLDLSEVRSGAHMLSALLSRKQAMTISTEMNRQSAGTIQNGKTAAPATGNSYSLVQNNYSPKALSRIDIYRQTKNQFSALKGLVET